MTTVILTKSNTGYDTRRFPTAIQQERKPSGLMQGDEKTVRQQCEARDLAFEAILDLYSGKFEESKEKARKALQLSPNCIDAYLARLLAMTQLVDGDTVLCGLRELLYSTRERYSGYIRGRSVCYQMTRTRPYIRVLMAIGCVAYTINRIDIATQAYETVLGANGTDAPNARNPLVSCYLILIGLKRRGENVILTRTPDHLKRLLDLEYMEFPVFGPIEQETMKRWAQIFLSYMRTGPSSRWQKLVQSEWNRSEVIVLAILDPVYVEKNPIPKVFFDTDGRGFEDVIDDTIPKEELKDRDYESLPPIEDFTTIDYLRRAMREWPDMAASIRKLLGLSYGDKAEEKIGGDAKDKENDDEARAEQKAKCEERIEELISEGRKAIREGRYRDGLDACTKAKQVVLEMIPPRERWYKHASFVIASNRATCAALLGEWELARIDSMTTLIMKPDHIRTYERLPRIASALFCSRLSKRLDKLVSDWMSNTKVDDDHWEERSQTGMAMMLWQIMCFSRTKSEEYWDEQKDFFLDDGVNKFFTPIHDFPCMALSYLSDDDTNTCEEEQIEDGVLIVKNDGTTGRSVQYMLETQELDLAWVAYSFPPFVAQMVIPALLSRAANS